MTTTQASEELKQIVKEKYGKIADQSKESNESSCCGATGSCSTIDYSVMADDYTHLKGYVADANLGLGCGLPTEFAQIKEGDTVIDLGSGAGNDCFIARAIAGEKGKIIGIDFTEKMIEKAKANAAKLSYKNVEFRQGDIENMPVAGNVADVVVSNCVLNLVPNKQQAFTEIFRVLKIAGHFSVSDIVLVGELAYSTASLAQRNLWWKWFQLSAEPSEKAWTRIILITSCKLKTYIMRATSWKLAADWRRLLNSKAAIMVFSA